MIVQPNEIRAIGNAILVQFIDDTAEGKFIDKHTGQIILTNQDLSVQARPRWGRVTHAGPDVFEEVQVGKFVLLEQLAWTVAFTLGNEEKFWKSDATKVMAIADNEQDCLKPF